MSLGLDFEDSYVQKLHHVLLLGQAFLVLNNHVLVLKTAVLTELTHFRDVEVALAGLTYVQDVEMALTQLTYFPDVEVVLTELTCFRAVEVVPPQDVMADPESAAQIVVVKLAVAQKKGDCGGVDPGSPSRWLRFAPLWSLVVLRPCRARERAAAR